MKKIIKLFLLLVISVSVSSSPICNGTCPLTALKAKLKIVEYTPAVDENDWILNTRFKY